MHYWGAPAGFGEASHSDGAFGTISQMLADFQVLFSNPPSSRSFQAQLCEGVEFVGLKPREVFVRRGFDLTEMFYTFKGAASVLDVANAVAGIRELVSEFGASPHVASP